VIRAANILTGFVSPTTGCCFRPKPTEMCSPAGHALRVHVERIDRVARRHEQPVAVAAAEADVGGALGQRMKPIALPAGLNTFTPSSAGLIPQPHHKLPPTSARISDRGGAQHAVAAIYNLFAVAPGRSMSEMRNRRGRSHTTAHIRFAPKATVLRSKCSSPLSAMSRLAQAALLDHLIGNHKQSAIASFSEADQS
jgi:hypothetical protein